jgi:type II secretory pathway pseudopilin PulG
MADNIMMSFWSNADVLRQLSHGLMWCALIFAVLAAGATGLRFYVDRRAGELSSASQQVRDEANQQRLRASEAELQALRDQGQDNQKRHELAEKELATLSAKNEPRTLSPTNRDALLTFLRQQVAGKVVIKASVSTPDARAYGDQIAAALKSAGWSVRIDNALFAGSDTTGLWITVKDQSTSPDGAGVLQAAFKVMGLDARGQIDPAMDAAAGEFWLCIGNR